MKNIHVLPTDKPSRIYTCGSALYMNKVALQHNTNQNIYITSDEYIGLSYYLDGNLVRKGVVDDKDYWEVRKDYKKIILTTDSQLIADGVQAIDDEFLEWFVKNPSCEFVEVETDIIGAEGGLEFRPFFGYKIIIPKEEPKRKIDTCYNFNKEIPMKELL